MSKRRKAASASPMKVTDRERFPRRRGRKSMVSLSPSSRRGSGDRGSCGSTMACP
jgi:hypothetical protein